MADPAPNRLGICLMRHSFISRLERYLTFHPDLMNLRLYREQYDMIFRARGGLRIASLANLGFLQIGENDVLSNNLDTTVRDIVALASFIRSRIGIRTVIIGQSLRRQPLASSPDFNNRIVDINVKLRTQTSSLDGVTSGSIGDSGRICHFCTVTGYTFAAQLQRSML